MSYRWFDHIANSVTVRHVMQRVLSFTVVSQVDLSAQIDPKEITRDPLLRKIDAAMVICDSRPTAWIPKNEFGRIKLSLQDGQPVYEASFRCPIGEFVKPFDGGSFIAANATLLHAVGTFPGNGRRAPFFVIEDTEIVGSLTFDRLVESFAFRTCMLGLVLQLEEQASELLMMNPEESLEYLPNQRKEKLWERAETEASGQIMVTEITCDTAIEELEYPFQQTEPGWYYALIPARMEMFIGPYNSEEAALRQAELASEEDDRKNELEKLQYISALAWSQFADKKEMIAKRAKQGDLGTEWSAKRALKVMKAAEKLRNYCAHPGSMSKPQEFGDPNKLRDFLREITELTRRIGNRVDEIEGTIREPDLSVIVTPTVS